MDQFDQTQNFLFDNHPVRGTIVRLQDAYQTVIGQHPYPPLLQRLLGEAMVGAVLLAGMTKHPGKFTLQFQGEGALKLLSVRTTHDLKIRGIAKWEGRLDSEASLATALGKGILAFTYELEAQSERYQSVVAVSGHSIAEALENYFAQSEQCATRLIFASTDCVAAGLLLQTLPADEDRRQRSFEHTVHLADTLKPAELLQLDNTALLHRLYHQETLRLFEARAVKFACSCTIPRMENALLIMGRKEVMEILTHHATVEVTCEFCNRKYEFDQAEVERLFVRNKISEAPKTIH